MTTDVMVKECVAIGAERHFLRHDTRTNFRGTLPTSGVTCQLHPRRN